MQQEVGGDDRAFLRQVTPPDLPASGPGVRIADLFSGCGGLSLGVREACRSLRFGFEVAVAIDLDEAATACFEKNFRPRLLLKDDVMALLPGGLGEPITPAEAEWAERVGHVDLLVGGPPCQGHSDLNNYSPRSDPKNDLYLCMGRAAEVWRPCHVIVENVVGVAKARQRVVQRVAAHLAELGYFVDHGIVDLLRIGVPQSRRRHILLASRTRRLHVRTLASRCEIETRDVRWAIADLEDAPPTNLLDEPAVPSADNKKRIDYLFENDLHDLPNGQRPPCHRDKPHRYHSIYGRLRWDRPAQTITTGFYSMPMGRYVHPSRRRTLTAHEAARFQFFPDYFDFSPVKNRSGLARVIGNAVPMKLSYVLARALLGSEVDQ